MNVQSQSNIAQKPIISHHLVEGYLNHIPNHKRANIIREHINTGSKIVTDKGNKIVINRDKIKHRIPPIQQPLLPLSDNSLQISQSHSQQSHINILLIINLFYF